MRFLKAMSLMAIVMLIGCTAVAYAKPRADKFPCQAIKGKTYISWMSGTFDGPEAILSFKIIFDKVGNGSTYEFFIPNTAATSAQVLKRKVTCVATPAGTTSADGSPVGRWSLSFPEGIVYITSYNGGSRARLRYAVFAGRQTQGWMLQLPSEP